MSPFIGVLVGLFSCELLFDPDSEDPPERLDIESLVSVDRRSLEDDVDDDFAPEMLTLEFVAIVDVALENVVSSVMRDFVEASLGTNSSVDSAPEEDSEMDRDEHGLDESSLVCGVVWDSAARNICSIILRAEAVGENLDASLTGDGLTCLLANPVRTGDFMLLGTRFSSVGVDGVGGGALPANSYFVSTAVVCWFVDMFCWMTLLPISCKIFIDLEMLSERLLLIVANRFDDEFDLLRLSWLSDAAVGLFSLLFLCIGLTMKILTN